MKHQSPERVVVIGGGFSGLATAGLLAASGHRVTLLEKQDTLGGRAGRLNRDGFSFDTGPSWYLMPEVIEHWFELMGTSTAAELDLVDLDVGYRTWFEGHADPLDMPTGPGAVAAFESVQTRAPGPHWKSTWPTPKPATGWHWNISCTTASPRHARCSIPGCRPCCPGWHRCWPARWIRSSPNGSAIPACARSWATRRSSWAAAPNAPRPSTT